MTQENPQQEKPGPFMHFLQLIMTTITPGHVWLYRKLGGRLVNRATAGMPVMLLTTTGRHTGQPRTVALGHVRDGDAVIVAGTNGGLHPLPGWIYNLRANPETEVQVGSDRYPAHAEFLEGDEWKQHWEQLVAAYPNYEDARRWAGREVPLVRLVRNE